MKTIIIILGFLIVGVTAYSQGGMGSIGGGTDSTGLSNRIDLKLDITDTSDLASDADVALKLAKTDTTYFLHSTDTSSLSTRIDLKLDIADTSGLASGLRDDIVDSIAELGTTALDDIADPDAATTISLDDGETIQINSAEDAGTVLTINMTDADAGGNIFGIDLIHAGDANSTYQFMRCYDNTSDLQFDISSNGNVTSAGTITAGSWMLSTYGDIMSRKINDTPATTPAFTLQKARDGTPTSNVSDEDYIGEINFKGYHTDAYSTGATIRAIVDNTPGEDDMPSRLEFLTSADGSDAPTVRQTIDATGDVTFTEDVTADGSLTSPTIIASGAIGNTGQLDAAGYQFKTVASTITENFTTGTRPLVVANGFAVPTFATEENVVTITNAATLYIASPPTAGANITITNPYALYTGDGNTYLADTVKAESDVKIAGISVENRLDTAVYDVEMANAIAAAEGLDLTTVRDTLDYLTRGIFNILDYGAIEGDTNTDTTAINAAIRAAAVAIGGSWGAQGIVYVPPGLWYVTGGIVMKDRVTLKMAKNAVMKVPSGYEGSAIIFPDGTAQSDVHIEGGFFMEATTTTYKWTGIKIEKTTSSSNFLTFSTIRDVVFYKVGIGIDVVIEDDAWCNDILYERIQFRGFKRGLRVRETGNSLFQGNKFVSCTFQASDSTLIAIDALNEDYNKFIGCEFWDFHVSDNPDVCVAVTTGQRNEFIGCKQLPNQEYYTCEFDNEAAPMKVAKGTITYTENGVMDTIAYLPNYVIIWDIEMRVATGFNDSGTDLLSIGVSTNDDYWVNDHDVSSSGFATLTPAATWPALIWDNNVITATYVGQNSNASAGSATIWIHYTDR